VASDTAGPAKTDGPGEAADGSPDAQHDDTGGPAKSGNGGGVPKASASEAGSAPASTAFTDAPPVVPTVLKGLDLGPACSQCGGMMQRTGSCYTCSSCGNNTGCG